MVVAVAAILAAVLGVAQEDLAVAAAVLAALSEEAEEDLAAVVALADQEAFLALEAAGLSFFIGLRDTNHEIRMD